MGWLGDVVGTFKDLFEGAPKELFPNTGAAA